MKGTASPQLLTLLENWLRGTLQYNAGGTIIGGATVITDEDGNVITDFGRVTAGAEGNYSTVMKDFVATPNVGTNTVTVTAQSYGFTLEKGMIAMGKAKKCDSSNNWSDIKMSNVDVVSNVITFGDQANFVSGDTVEISFVGPPRYDSGNDTKKVENQVEGYAHYTAPENWSLSNVTGAQRRIVSMDSFRGINAQYFVTTTGTNTGTVKAYVSNVGSADTNSLDNWTDRSSKILGAASIVQGGTGTTEGYVESTGPTSPLKYMFEVDLTAAGTAAGVNAVDFYIKKFY